MFSSRDASYTRFVHGRLMKHTNIPSLAQVDEIATLELLESSVEQHSMQTVEVLPSTGRCIPFGARCFHMGTAILCQTGFVIFDIWHSDAQP